MKKPRKNKNASSQRAFNSQFKSAFKYVYLTAFFVLLSGLFHPIITQTPFDSVIIGTLVLFVGLAGGILLYRAVASDSRKTICLGGGFGLVTASLSCIFYLTGRF